MGIDYYKITDNCGWTIAGQMSLNTAIILVRALFNEYYNEPWMSFTIKREEATESDENNAAVGS